MKRNSQALFLPHSPLVFTLGVVHFDPILAVANYIPEIQESLRMNGFPKVRERFITHRIVQTEGSELRAELKKQWEFHDAANQTSIMVDQDAVMVQTTAYSTYERFREILELALKCVADRLGVSEVLRCGLRYIDIVNPPQDAAITDWVHAGLLGLPALDGFQRKRSHSSTELGGGDGSTIRIRASFVPQGIVLPPDLLPCDLAFGSPPLRETPFALLDFDHFSLLSFPYGLEATLKHLSTLHDGLDRAFRSSVTSNALEQWQQP